MLMRLASHNWSSTSTTTSRRSWKSRSSRLVHSGRRSTQAPPAFCTSCIGMGLIPCKVMVGAKRNVNHAVLPPIFGSGFELSRHLQWGIRDYLGVRQTSSKASSSASSGSSSRASSGSSFTASLLVKMDAAGNLYGTTNADGAFGKGNVFKLSPSTGGWTYTDLHDFTGGSDGGAPLGNLAIDADGNIYGTTTHGGIDGVNGVIWEITP
jgi:uncharacterized repeat protein (TIGR03803 family)